MDPLPTDNNDGNGNEDDEPPKKRSRRWDAGQVAASSGATAAGTDADASAMDGGGGMDDALDKFMDQLEAGATGQVTALDIDVGGSMQRASDDKGRTKATSGNVNVAVGPIVGGSGGVITAAELERLQQGMGGRRKHAGMGEGDSESDTGGAGGGGQPLFTHSDWESDAPNRHADESASEVRRPVRHLGLLACLLACLLADYILYITRHAKLSELTSQIAPQSTILSYVAVRDCTLLCSVYD